MVLSPGKLPEPGVAGRPEPALPGIMSPDAPAAPLELAPDAPDEELALAVLPEDELRPLEKSGSPGMDADEPDCRAPGDGIDGMPPEEPADPDEELDAVELDDDELDDEELDEDELDDELELEDDGMEGIDDDGIDGICGMLDCVCWVVSHALSNAADSPMAITRRCCNSFIFPYSICSGQIDIDV